MAVRAPGTNIGGTSVAAPCWAGLIALADQMRVAAGQSTLDGPTQTLPRLYSLPAADFHDITSGTSTGSPNYTAAAGYDLVTGLGTPVANLLVPALAGVSVPVTLGPGSLQAGMMNVAYNRTITASGGTGTITLTASEHPEHHRRPDGARQRQRQPDDQRHADSNGNRDLYGHRDRRPGRHDDRDL